MREPRYPNPTDEGVRKLMGCYVKEYSKELGFDEAKELLARSMMFAIVQVGDEIDWLGREEARGASAAAPVGMAFFRIKSTVAYFRVTST
jgi:hypothetical protein